MSLSTVLIESIKPYSFGISMLFLALFCFLLGVVFGSYYSILKEKRGVQDE